jgi:hypothetical protein
MRSEKIWDQLSISESTFFYRRLSFLLVSSVVDPGCLSRIPDPDFYPSRIPEREQKRVVKKFFCHTFFCSHKFTKLKIILFLKC